MTLPQTTILDEQFQYVDGALPTVSSSLWATGTSAGDFGGQGTTNVASHALNITTKVGSAYLPSALTLGSGSYTITATFVANAIDIIKANQYHISYRGDAANLGTKGQVFRIINSGDTLWTWQSRNFGGVTDPGGAGGSFANSIVAGQPFTVAISVAGNVVTGYVNGVQIAQETVTGNSSTSLVGIGFSSNSTSSNMCTRFTVTRDIVAPNAPGKPTGTYSSTTEGVTLTWAAPGSGDALSSYNIYRGSVLIGTSVATSFFDSKPPYGTTPTYQISAVNAAGESTKGTASDAVTVTALSNATKVAAVSMTGLIV